MTAEDSEDAQAYQAAIACNNALRRKLNALLRNRNRVAMKNSYRFQALLEKIRYKINEHSELIAALEASIAAEGPKEPV